MKKISVPFFAFIILTVFFVSCQKDTVQNNLQPMNEKASIENLKAYYKAQTFAGVNNSRSSNFTALSPDLPDWEQILFSAEKNMYIIPVSINASKTSKNFRVYKYLVIHEKSGQKAGFFYYAISDNMKTNKAISAQQILNSINFSDGRPSEINPPDFTLVRSSLNKNDLLLDAGDQSTKASGRYISIKKAPETKPADKEEVSSFAPYFDCTAAGGTVVTIEWYWQTYRNGVLIEEIYLYSTTECVGISGGGGTGGTSCYNDSEANAILNSVSITNPNNMSYEYGIQINKLGVIREPKNSTWEYCQVNALGIPSFTAPRYSARFTGTRFKYASPLNDPWKWEVFNYDKTVQTAGIVPPCFTISLSPTVTLLPTSDKLKTIVVIDYTVNVSVVYGGLSGQLQRSYSESANTNIYANG